ncbi:MAG: NAD(P)-binding domain-containing protein [Verrucomicrobiota bacterium]
MQIAWIGTGVMGSTMAGHLLTASHELTLYSRTKSKAAGLLRRGARWAMSPRAAAAAADSVCVMVGFPEDVEAVVLGPEGALQAMHADALLVDFHD